MVLPILWRVSARDSFTAIIFHISDHIRFIGTHAEYIAIDAGKV